MTYIDEYFTMLEQIVSEHGTPPSIVRRQLDTMSRQLGEDPLYIGAIISQFLSLFPKETTAETYTPSWLGAELIQKFKDGIKINYTTTGVYVRVDPFLINAHHQQLFDTVDSIVDQMKASVLTFRCGKCKMVHQLGFDVAVDLELPAAESKICAFCEAECGDYMLSEIPSCYEEAIRIIELKDIVVKLIMAIPEGSYYQFMFEKHRPERFKVRIHNKEAHIVHICYQELVNAGFDLEKESETLFIVKNLF